MLRRGDAALALPRLGGMARPDGVVIVSEHFWAFAGVDGSIREGQMPKPPEAVHNLPLARGLVRTARSGDRITFYAHSPAPDLGPPPAGVTATLVT